MAERTPTDMAADMSERISKEMSNVLSERMSQNMSERVSENMSERMSEDISKEMWKDKSDYSRTMKYIRLASNHAATVTPSQVIPTAQRSQSRPTPTVLGWRDTAVASPHISRRSHHKQEPCAWDSSHTSANRTIRSHPKLLPIGRMWSGTDPTGHSTMWDLLSKIKTLWTSASNGPCNPQRHAWSCLLWNSQFLAKRKLQPRSPQRHARPQHDKRTASFQDDNTNTRPCYSLLDQFNQKALEPIILFALVFVHNFAICSISLLEK